MDVAISVLRTGAQALVGFLVTWLAARGLDVPLAAQSWLIDTLIVGGGIAAYTAAVRWLETRRGTSPLARAARGLGRLLMLGTRPPTYTAALAGPRLSMRPPRAD